MADDKNNKDGRDRSKVSGTEDYEVEYMSKKTVATAEEVRKAIKAVGNDRQKVEAYLKKK